MFLSCVIEIAMFNMLVYLTIVFCNYTYIATMYVLTIYVFHGNWLMDLDS